MQKASLLIGLLILVAGWLFLPWPSFVQVLYGKELGIDGQTNNSVQVWDHLVVGVLTADQIQPGTPLLIQGDIENVDQAHPSSLVLCLYRFRPNQSARH